LAHEYGFACDDFYDGLSPETKILTDHHILNRLIDEENKAQEVMRKKQKDQHDHPGMERDESIDVFWARTEREDD